MKKKLKKGENLSYSKLELAPYLSNDKISNNDKKNILRARIRMVPLAGFFRGKFGSPNCQLGCNEIENYQHILICPLQNGIDINLKFNIDNINNQYYNNINEISRSIYNIIEKRTNSINVTST